MALVVIFFKTVGGNNNGGRWPVLSMPILSCKSFKYHNSHSYNLIWHSSMLCMYKFNLCINVILPVTSSAICAICSVYKSWHVKNFSICIVLFLRPLTVLTISCVMFVSLSFWPVHILAKSLLGFDTDLAD